MSPCLWDAALFILLWRLKPAPCFFVRFCYSSTQDNQNELWSKLSSPLRGVQCLLIEHSLHGRVCGYALQSFSCSSPIASGLMMACHKDCWFDWGQSTMHVLKPTHGCSQQDWWVASLTLSLLSVPHWEASSVVIVVASWCWYILTSPYIHFSHMRCRCFFIYF